MPDKQTDTQTNGGKNRTSTTAVDVGNELANWSMMAQWLRLAVTLLHKLVAPVPKKVK